MKRQSHVRQECFRLRPMPLVLCGLMGTVSCLVQGATFTNATPINLPVGAPASPYPSAISVSQVTGAVVNVSVTLNGVSHVFPDDLDVLLVGPGGMVMLMSDAGGSNSISGVNLTFSQDSSATLPDSGPIISGSYQPTDYETGDVLPAPAPAGPYGTDLTVFNGTNPNGTWQLFAYDDATFNGGGSIGGGWRLVLDLATPPVITTHPQSQTVAPGSTVSFGVTVTGTPPFGFQWLRNGQVLVPFGQGAPTLTITNVQAANAGTYAVVVTNSADRSGVMSSNAELNVFGPLTLVETPRSLTIGPGATVMFRVTAAGNPPLNYQWRLNGALLPDQTNSILVLNKVQAASGGNFSVTVWNDGGVFTTAPAVLLVPDATGPEAADDFNDRPRLSGLTELKGVLQGNSSLATSERGEPIFPGGGKSVWYEWIAPSNGIVTLNLRGSSFDTLLSVFTGTTLNNLTLVTKDDDSSGFYTSAFQFNAQRGTAYQWMIDGLGFDGAGGEYTLSWLLTTTSLKVPVIVTNPEPQGVKQGSNATFFVVTESRDDHYQWLFNDVPIGGATGSVHTVFNASSANVGFYSVLVSNQNGSVLRSPSVPVQVGSGIDQFAADKIYPVDRPFPGVISVGLGGTGWNEFASQANGGQGDPNPCGKPFLKTQFQSVHAEDNGVIQIDSVGSQVYLLLGVYRDFPTGDTNFDVLVSCDTTNGPANLPCVVQFNASQGSNYTAVVAALQGDGTETIKITAMMGIAPPINGSPQCLHVTNGGSLMLQVPANNWAPPPAVQWRFNGQAIPGANSTMLAISNFNVSMAGTYSVVLSNFVAATTNTVAHVAQSGPPLLRGRLSPGGASPDFVVQGSADQPFVLQTSTDLGGPWTAVATNQDPCFALSFTNLNVLLDSQRYFRAVHWP